MKPFSVLIAGLPKTGKTHALLSTLQSKVVPPERVLYIDNHGSTRAYPSFHRYTLSEQWGIWELDYTDVEQMDTKIETIIQRARAGHPPYDIVVIDDLSEMEMTTFDKEESKFAGKDKRQLWGEHLELMCQRLRRLTIKSGAALLASARVASMDDYTKPGVKDPETKQLVRPQVVRPQIRGKSGEWIPYIFDMLVWQQLERGRGVPLGVWNFNPEGSIWSGNRWAYYPSWPKTIKEPTYDILVELITAAETWQATQI